MVVDAGIVATAVAAIGAAAAVDAAVYTTGNMFASLTAIGLFPYILIVPLYCR